MSDVPTVDLPDGFSLVYAESLTSTNDEAKKLAEEGALHNTIVWAARQTSGRGRRGRAWESGEGNLFTTAVIRPDCTIDAAMQLGFVAAVAVVEALNQFVPETVNVNCKWPNDVLADGAKICGMLLETGGIIGTRVEWLVIGIGINVAHSPDVALYPTTHLGALCAETPSAGGVLSALWSRFASVYDDWSRSGFGRIRETWLHHASGLGAPITVKGNKKNRHGVFETLDEQGALILRTEEGLERITAGDVFLSPAG